MAATKVAPGSPLLQGLAQNSPRWPRGPEGPLLRVLGKDPYFMDFFFCCSFFLFSFFLKSVVDSWDDFNWLVHHLIPDPLPQNALHHVVTSHISMWASCWGRSR